MAKQTIEIADKPTVDEILALLNSAEVGLAALKLLLGNSADAASLNAVKAALENGTYGLSALKAAITGRANETTAAAIKAMLENASTGLGALKAAITGRANESTVTAVKSLLENGTYGLNALKTAITGNLKTIKSVQRGNVTIANNVKVYTVTISAVNMSKAFVIASQGLSYVDNSNVSNHDIFAELTSATTIRIGAGASTGKMAWQVIEFY